MILQEQTLRGLDELLVVVVSAIARHTPSPGITHIENEALFALRVDARDQGRFVGKEGSHIWAIQTLFWFAGLAQYGWSYSIKLLEPESPLSSPQKTPFRFNPKWPREKIQKLIDIILNTAVPLHATYSILETDTTSAVVSIKLQRYLERNLADPCFVEALSIVLRVAGMSNGVKLKTEAIFT